MTEGCFSLCTPNKRGSSDSIECPFTYQKSQKIPSSRLRDLRVRFNQNRSSSDPINFTSDSLNHTNKCEGRIYSDCVWNEDTLNRMHLAHSLILEESQAISFMCHSHFSFPDFQIANEDSLDSNSLQTSTNYVEYNKHYYFDGDSRDEEIEYDVRERGEKSNFLRQNASSSLHRTNSHHQVEEEDKEQEINEEEKCNNSKGFKYPMKESEDPYLCECSTTASECCNSTTTKKTTSEESGGSSSKERTKFRPKKSPLLRIVSVPDTQERVEIRDIYSSSITRELASNVLAPRKKMTKHWSMDETQTWFYSRTSMDSPGSVPNVGASNAPSLVGGIRNKMSAEKRRKFFKLTKTTNSVPYSPGYSFDELQLSDCQRKGSDDVSKSSCMSCHEFPPSSINNSPKRPRNRLSYLATSQGLVRSRDGSHLSPNSQPFISLPSPNIQSAKNTVPLVEGLVAVEDPKPKETAPDSSQMIRRGALVPPKMDGGGSGGSCGGGGSGGCSSDKSPFSSCKSPCRSSIPKQKDSINRTSSSDDNEKKAHQSCSISHDPLNKECSQSCSAGSSNTCNANSFNETSRHHYDEQENSESSTIVNSENIDILKRIENEEASKNNVSNVKGRNYPRRSSVVVIPPMQVCPGDLLVYSKALTRLGNEIDGSSTSNLASENDNFPNAQSSAQRRSKNTWSLLKIFDREKKVQTSKTATPMDLETILMNMTPSEFHDEHLMRVMGLSWTDFLDLLETDRRRSVSIWKNSGSSTTESSDSEEEDSPGLLLSCAPIPVSTITSTTSSSIVGVVPQNVSPLPEKRKFLSQMRRPSSSSLAEEEEESELGRSSSPILFNYTPPRKGSDLTKAEIKRREAIWDLLQSENNFLIDHLMVLKNVYMEPLKKAQVEGSLMFAEPEVLFGNLDELTCGQSSFIISFSLQSLQTIGREDDGLFNFLPKFQIRSNCFTAFLKDMTKRRTHDQFLFKFTSPIVDFFCLLSGLKVPRITTRCNFYEFTLLFSLNKVNYSFCKDFLGLFLKLVREDGSIPVIDLMVDLFGQKGQRARTISQAYHRYALNYINALNYLESLRRNSEFLEFEKWCNRDIRCKKLQLTDLLIAPVHHIMRTPLVFRSILSKTIDSEEKKVISKILEVKDGSLRELDDKMRWLTNFDRLLEIQRNIVWPSFVEMESKQYIPEFLKSALSRQPCERLIVSPRRQIIMEGALLLLDSGKPTEMFVILFDDLLVITRKKKSLAKKKSTLSENWGSSSTKNSDVSMKYIVHKQPLSLDRFFIHEVSESEAASAKLDNAFILICLNRFQQITVVHTFQAESSDLKKTWIEKLKKAQDTWKKTLDSTLFKGTSSSTAPQNNHSPTDDDENPYTNSL